MFVKKNLSLAGERSLLLTLHQVSHIMHCSESVKDTHCISECKDKEHPFNRYLKVQVLHIKLCTKTPIDRNYLTVSVIIHCYVCLLYQLLQEDGDPPVNESLSIENTLWASTVIASGKYRTGGVPVKDCTEALFHSYVLI